MNALTIPSESANRTGEKLISSKNTLYGPIVTLRVTIKKAIAKSPPLRNPSITPNMIKNNDSRKTIDKILRLVAPSA